MSENILSKDRPLEPTIELDGGYTVCSSCWQELEPYIDIYPNCKQKQDWSWLRCGN